MAIEKGQSAYRLGEKTIRILNRAHLSKYLQKQVDAGREGVADNIKTEVKTYARKYPGKVKIISH